MHKAPHLSRSNTFPPARPKPDRQDKLSYSSIQMHVLQHGSSRQHPQAPRRPYRRPRIPSLLTHLSKIRGHIGAFPPFQRPNRRPRLSSQRGPSVRGSYICDRDRTCKGPGGLFDAFLSWIRQPLEGLGFSRLGVSAVRRGERVYRPPCRGCKQVFYAPTDFSSDHPGRSCPHIRPSDRSSRSISAGSASSPGAAATWSGGASAGSR